MEPMTARAGDYVSKRRAIDQALPAFRTAQGWQAFQASQRDALAARCQASSS